MNLFDLVMKELLRQERKHDLGDGHAERTINRMTNIELLRFVSDQFEFNDIKLVKGEN
jgi:hypothetical protein